MLYISYSEIHNLVYYKEFDRIIINSTVPDYQFLNSSNNWMIKHFRTSNIGHFLEVMNYLIHYYLHMDQYPAVFLFKGV